MAARHLPVIAALAVLSAAAPASAQNLYALSGTVRSDDLDLGSPAGMSVYEQRVHDAARRACSARGKIEATRCRHEFRMLAMSHAELAMGAKPHEIAQNP